MASDQLVHARDVLDALRQVQRPSRCDPLRELERVEPDLAEHIMEELSRLHHELVRHDIPPKRARQLDRRCESLVLVAVLALRRAYVRLWREQMTGTRLVQLDPSLKPKREGEGDADHGGVSGLP